MKQILPHVKLGLDQHGAAVISVADHELFDFIDDYVNEGCGLICEYVSVYEIATGEMLTMHFHPRYSVEDIESALKKLSPKKVEEIYAINN
ncbi:MAG: hypothetical protein AAGB04_32120 [Pseudomonadota bacterium]